MPSNNHQQKYHFKVIIIIVLILCVLFTLSTKKADYDLWGYLGFGRLFFETENFPYHDVYSYVPTLKPWIYHEWLTGVLFYLIYEHLGGAGIQLLKYAIGLLTVFFVYKTGRRRGADILGAAFGSMLVTAYLVVSYSPVRAQVFTYCFFALVLFLLEETKRSNNRLSLYLIPPIFVIWCNLHGGFVSGLGLIALYCAGEALGRRPFVRYVVILIISALATLINPYDIKYWGYIIRATTMPRPEITEWGSIIQTTRTGLSILTLAGYSLILFLPLLLISRGLLKDKTIVLTMGATLLLGLAHVRHLTFFSIVVGSYVPPFLTLLFLEMKNWHIYGLLKERIGWKMISSAVCALLIVGSYNLVRIEPWVLEVPSRPSKKLNDVYYPVKAIEWIKQRELTGKILTDFAWGEYALWNLYPQCLVAIDGRYETVYPEFVSKAYFDFLYGRQNWRQFLEIYPPDMILIRKPSDIQSLIQTDPDWIAAFEDEGSSLFMRR